MLLILLLFFRIISGDGCRSANLRYMYVVSRNSVRKGSAPVKCFYLLFYNE